MTVQQINDFDFELFNNFSSHDAFPIAEDWLATLKELPGIQRGEISGELRRGKHSIDHIDIVLAADDPGLICKRISELNGIQEILEQDKERILLLLPSEMRLVVSLTLPSQFAALLLLTTGSEPHLTKLAEKAAAHGIQFGRSGFRKDGNLLEFEREEQIYAALGLPRIPPELRESGEEVNHVLDLDLNRLIKLEDIQADLHIHTDWSDGHNSIDEMAQAAIQQGLSIIAVTDHSPYLLKKYRDASYLQEQSREIDRLRKEYQNQLTILKGIEVDIMPDGSLDLSEDLLRKMDVVVASMHIELDQPLETATTRLINAIENPYVNIIGHPGGRIYPMLDIIDLDWERVYRAAAYNDVALEINSHRSHPIFDDQKARAAASLGIPIAIDSDSHKVSMLANSRFGIAIARRARLKSDQVINTWSANHLKLWLQHKKKSYCRGAI